jgi:arsenical pump membrane protein
VSSSISELTRAILPERSLTLDLAVSAGALAVVLAWAVIRPRGWPEAMAAVPAAALVLATGAIPGRAALVEAERIGPVVGFLAAVLVLAQCCDTGGLFRACGGWLATASRGRPGRLLAQVFVVAALTTTVLSLDATVVLLTPVVFATAARLDARPKPHVYACTHLANSASLLLPVSNLTNLLAFAASGLAFSRFAALMALPWAAAIGTEYLVFRRFFAADLGAGAGRPPASQPPASQPGVPVFVLAVVAATLAGFVVADLAGVNPAWAAFAGAAVLAGRYLAQRRTTPAELARAAAVPFLLFVVCLAIVVVAVVSDGLGAAVRPVIPTGTSLPALLGTAAAAAVLANVINNLPTVLLLLPLVPHGGVLAMLLGANIGPNLTYAGSLATLLWRRVMHEHGPGPSLREFTTLGLLTVPAGLVLAVLALWGALHVIGG